MSVDYKKIAEEAIKILDENRDLGSIIDAYEQLRAMTIKKRKDDDVLEMIRPSYIISSKGFGRERGNQILSIFKSNMNEDEKDIFRQNGINVNDDGVLDVLETMNGAGFITAEELQWFINRASITCDVFNHLSLGQVVDALKMNDEEKA